MYEVGQVAILECTFTDEDGAAADPLTVDVLIQTPDGVETTHAPAHTGLGMFRWDQVLTVAGEWVYKFRGTSGLIAAVSGVIEVATDPFDSPVSPVPLADYFTAADFREFVGVAQADRYPSDGEVLRAQAAVVEDLETWARTAWPAVDRSLATGPRARVETRDGQVPVVLDRLPIIEVTQLLVGGSDDTATVGDVATGATWILSKDAGVLYAAASIPGIRPNWPFAPGPPGTLVIAYTFGFQSTPEIVRQAAMMATRTWLDQTGGKARGSKIPGGLSQYSTETATFVMANKPPEPPDPWAWDGQASGLLRSYWGDRRARRRMASG